ncbi:MAG: glycosyltransferase family 2 protein [Bacilli bacterium]|nr:glycosyltransferase family 2 protein [Bacilli bacterium]
MKTAIIILNYNDYNTTFEMLNRIKDYKVLDMILVVDNHSSDDSFNKLKKLETDKIKVIETNENKGYAYGNNYGLKYLEAKDINNVIISNPDVMVDEDTIIKLKEDLESPDVTLVAPIIDEHGVLSRGWKLPRFREDFLSNINYFHKYASKLLSYKDEYYNKELVQVEAVHGCFFMIKLDKFKEIGYFDDATFLYYEENILGSKLKKHSYKSYIDTSVLVKHNLSVSVNKSFNSLKKYKILKTSQRYYEKEYNKLNLFGLLLLKISYYISYGISYIYLKVLNIGKKDV